MTDVVISPEQAVRRAFWTVKVPSLTVLLGPLLLGLLLIQLGYVPRYGVAGLKWVLAFFAVGFTGGWLVWSIRMPRWRLWAYRRVDDIAALEQLAVETQLIWPKGSILERTEIASKAMRAELQRLREAGGNGLRASTPE